MKTKNKLKAKPRFLMCVAFIIGTIFTLFLSFLYQNLDILKLPENEQQVVKIRLDDIETDCKIENEIIISQECSTPITISANSYINNFAINYNTDADFQWKINYTYDGPYEKLASAEIEGRGSRLINILSENLHSYVHDIELSIVTSSEIKLSDIIINNTLQHSFSIYLSFELIFILFFIIIFFSKNIVKKEENIFLILASIFGLIFFFVAPNHNFVVVDEESHFDRAYSALRGKTTEYEENAFLMTNVTPDMFNTSEEYESYYNALNSKNDVTTYNNHGVLFNPARLVYLPSAIIFNLSRFINLPFIVAFMLGRFINLALYIIIIFFAIKNTPRFKKTFLVIGLIPTSIILATRFHPDPYITSLILLGLSFLFKSLFENKNSNTIRNIIIFAACIIVASTAKMVYIPLVLLALIIPSDKFKNKKQRVIIRASIIIGSLLALIALVSPSSIANNNDPRGGEVNSSEQIALIKNNPIDFVHVFSSAAIPRIISNFFGRDTLFQIFYLHRVDFQPQSLYLIFLIMLIMTVLFDDRCKLKRSQIIFSSLIILIIWAFIYGALYLSFTPVGTNTILGVQDRYFIPLLAPLLFILSALKPETKVKNKDVLNRSILIVYSVMMIFLTFATIFPWI